MKSFWTGSSRVIAQVYLSHAVVLSPALLAQNLCIKEKIAVSTLPLWVVGQALSLDAYQANKGTTVKLFVQTARIGGTKMGIVWNWQPSWKASEKVTVGIMEPGSTPHTDQESTEGCSSWWGWDGLKTKTFPSVTFQLFNIFHWFIKLTHIGI